MPAPTPVNIPIVDFSACSLEKPLHLENEAVKTVCDDLVRAFEEYGVVYIVNHGLSTQGLKDLRRTSREFFNQPKEFKFKCVRTQENPKNGWVAEEMEYFSEQKAGDLKECFNISLLEIDTFPWPDDDVVPGFKSANRDFMITCNQLVRRLLTIFGTKLSPDDPDIFHRAHENFDKDPDNMTCLRNLYYPPMSTYTDKVLLEGQLRLSAHSDFGIFSFLFQDNVGGLEVQSLTDGEFFEAKPLDGAVMILAADQLERWTAGRVKAAVHRVSIPDDEDRRNRSRESTAYFVTPNSDFRIRCLDGSDTYAPTTIFEYSLMKIRNIQGQNDEVKKFIDSK